MNYLNLSDEKEAMNSLFTNIIVIEGSDGSGKKTQSEMLLDYICHSSNVSAHLLDFPDYKSDTGKLVTSMLSGTFGKDAKELNPYFTSPMYSLDRYQYFKQFMDHKKTINPIRFGICNRYTQSNLIHQGARLSASDLVEYWNWLYDFEYGKLHLPRPKVVIYLDVPYQISRENILKRAEETGNSIDINESVEYLHMVSENVQRLRKIVDWAFISCVDESGAMRSREDIHNDIKVILYNSRVEGRALFFTPEGL